MKAFFFFFLHSTSAVVHNTKGGGLIVAGEIFCSPCKKKTSPNSPNPSLRHQTSSERIHCLVCARCMYISRRSCYFSNTSCFFRLVPGPDFLVVKVPLWPWQLSRGGGVPRVGGGGEHLGLDPGEVGRSELVELVLHLPHLALPDSL